MSQENELPDMIYLFSIWHLICKDYFHSHIDSPQIMTGHLAIVWSSQIYLWGVLTIRIKKSDDHPPVPWCDCTSVACQPGCIYCHLQYQATIWPHFKMVVLPKISMYVLNLFPSGFQQNCTYSEPLFCLMNMVIHTMSATKGHKINLSQLVTVIGRLLLLS